MILPYGTEVIMRKQPRVTYLLIGLNVLIFLLVFFTGAEKRDIISMQWGFIPDEWSRISTFFSSMFLHGGWMHLIGNMYFLWIFGQVLEDKLGSKKYIIFYLAAGVAANISHLLTIGPFFADIPCIGASGAISGILGAYMVMSPYIRVKCFYLFIMFIRPLFGTFEIPSLIFIGGWFLMQLIYTASLSSGVTPVGVAYWAHVGGFILGMLAVGTPKIYRQSRILIARWIWQRKFVKAMELAQARDLVKSAEVLASLETDNAKAGDLNILLAQICFQAGDIQKAAAFANTSFRDALRVKNQAQTITAYYILEHVGKTDELKAHDYLILGRGFAKYKKIEQAISILLNAMRKFPGSSETDLILYELGDIYTRSQNYKRAEEAYTTLLKSCPNSKLYKSAEYCLHEIK